MNQSLLRRHDVRLVASPNFKGRLLDGASE
jgi:hypothetical protein